ncbi:Sucrose/H+ symporter, plant [Penicillium camemberti]|uniref:Sucrose/H+ symporter, plant n=1 Tax=Penicillium camemberti (strain FM 013) TaxID=1429867 RepID=A0A0G4PP38_PENC3|nr:Sucrose/H+ symporter, plant [Penicillium camemberti]
MVVLDDKHQELPGSNLDDKRLDESGSSTRAEDYDDDGKQTPPANDNAPLAEPEAPPRDISGWKWYLTLASILASTFLYALDATVVADLQSVIVQDLGGITKLSWLSVAFLLSATATNLVWGRVYGHFNAKWFYIFHVTIFEIGSAICGAAPSMNVMILGRAIAGVGGSGLYVGCMTLIAMTTTISERPIYISCTGLSWGLGIVLGPVIGGAFSESSVGWRWAFYINLFIGAVCAPFYLFLIPNKDPRPGASIKERAVELDYPGIVLQCGALTALIMAINLGGVTYPWNSGRIIAMFVVSGVLFIALGIQQVWTIGVSLSRRIIPVQFFRSKTVLILFATTASGGACAFIPIYMIPLFFQFTRNDAPLDAGVRLLPFVVVMVVFVFVNGNLMARLGYYMPWYLLGGLLIVVGSALMYTVEQGTSQGRVYGYSVPLGVGVGMFLQASFSVAQAVVSLENLAPAIGFITLAQFVGIILALAIGNAVLLNGCLDKIEAILPSVPSAEIQAAILGAQSDLVKNLSPELKTRVLDAIVKAIGDTYILTIAGGALVTLLSLLLRRDKLFGVASGIHAA